MNHARCPLSPSSVAEPSCEEDFDEGERTVFSTAVTLFAGTNPTWSLVGKGPLKLLKNTDTGHQRLLMRDESSTVLVNSVVDFRAKLACFEPDSCALGLNCYNFIDGCIEEQTLAIHFEDAAEVAHFKAAYEKAQTDMAALLGQGSDAEETKQEPRNVDVDVPTAEGFVALPDSFAGILKGDKIVFWPNSALGESSMLWDGTAVGASASALSVLKGIAEVSFKLEGLVCTQLRSIKKDSSIKIGPLSTGVSTGVTGVTSATFTGISGGGAETVPGTITKFALSAPSVPKSAAPSIPMSGAETKTKFAPSVPKPAAQSVPTSVFSASTVPTTSTGAVGSRRSVKISPEFAKTPSKTPSKVITQGHYRADINWSFA